MADDFPPSVGTAPSTTGCGGPGCGELEEFPGQVELMKEKRPEERLLWDTKH